jgi:hypothetical protein
MAILPPSLPWLSAVWPSRPLLGLLPECMHFLIALKPTLKETLCQIGCCDMMQSSRSILPSMQNDFITVSTGFLLHPSRHDTIISILLGWCRSCNCSYRIVWLILVMSKILIHCFPILDYFKRCFIGKYMQFSAVHVPIY